MRMRKYLVVYPDNSSICRDIISHLKFVSKTRIFAFSIDIKKDDISCSCTEIPLNKAGQPVFGKRKIFEKAFENDMLIKKLEEEKEKNKFLLNLIGGGLLLSKRDNSMLNISRRSILEKILTDYREKFVPDYNKEKI